MVHLFRQTLKWLRKKFNVYCKIFNEQIKKHGVTKQAVSRKA